MPLALGPVNFELGVIAGDRTINPLTSSAIAGPNDGKVSVENAKVEGMADFLVVHKTHTWIMMSSKVVNQVLHFLEYGKFHRAEEAD